MKTIRISARSRDKLLHIEGPGFLVNIQIGLTDQEGRPVSNISVIADGDRYKGDPEYWVNGEVGNSGVALRIVRTTLGEDC